MLLESTLSYIEYELLAGYTEKYQPNDLITAINACDNYATLIFLYKYIQFYILN